MASGLSTGTVASLAASREEELSALRAESRELTQQLVQAEARLTELEAAAAASAPAPTSSPAAIAGSGSWAPVNTGTATNLVIEDPASGIDIPAGEQAVVEITVRLQDTATNVPGLTFTNTAAWTYNQLDQDGSSERPGEPGTTGPMTIVGPELSFTKTGPATLNLGQPGTFTLELVVSDPTSDSAPDAVDVIVEGDVLVPEDYPTIDAAISGVAVGSAIQIGAGTWPCTIDLNGTDVTLIGAGTLESSTLCFLP